MQYQAARFALIDDAGQRGRIDLSELVKDGLVGRGLIHFCGHCTAIENDLDNLADVYHLVGDHTFVCIAASEIPVPNIRDLIMPDVDALCEMCVQQCVDGTGAAEGLSDAAG